MAQCVSFIYRARVVFHSIRCCEDDDHAEPTQNISLLEMRSNLVFVFERRVVSVSLPSSWLQEQPLVSAKRLRPFRKVRGEKMKTNNLSRRAMKSIVMGHVVLSTIRPGEDSPMKKAVHSATYGQHPNAPCQRLLR